MEIAMYLSNNNFYLRHCEKPTGDHYKTNDYSIWSMHFIKLERLGNVDILHANTRLTRSQQIEYLFGLFHD